MAKFLVVCGHGQGDPGAVGSGFDEAERVRYIGKKIVDEFNKYDKISATLYDTSKDLFQQGNINSVSQNYDQVIELHLNAASSSAKGTEVLVFLDGIDDVDKACLDAVNDYWTNRGFKDGSWVYNAVNSARPYRLIEFCFITNKNDMDIFNKKMDDISKKLVEKIAKVYGAKKREEKVKISILKVYTQYSYNEYLNAGSYDSYGKKYGYYYIYDDNSEKWGSDTVETKLNASDSWYCYDNSQGTRFMKTKTNTYLYKDENLKNKVIENGKHKFIPKDQIIQTRFVKNVEKEV